MDDKPYTLGTWRTFTTYRCRYCPFDTTEEAVALEHYAERHAPRPRGEVPSPILIADKSGREVAPVATPAKKRSKRNTAMEVHRGSTSTDGTADTGQVPGPAAGGELG